MHVTCLDRQSDSPEMRFVSLPYQSHHMTQTHPRSKMMEDSAANQQRGNSADLRLLASMANRDAQNQAYPDLGPLPALLGRCISTVARHAKLHWAAVEPQRIDPGSRPEYSQHCQNAIVPNRKAPEKKKKKPQA